MSTIIKILQDVPPNRSFLISEVGNIVRLLLLSQATNGESNDIFSALKRVKTSSGQRLLLFVLIFVHVHKQTFTHFTQNNS